MGMIRRCGNILCIVDGVIGNKRAFKWGLEKMKGGKPQNYHPFVNNEEKYT